MDARGLIHGRDLAVHGGMRSAFVAIVLLAACSDMDDTPPDHALSQSTELVQYNSCGDLEGDLKLMMIREVWQDIDRADEYWGRGDVAEGASGDSNGAS